jgi:hypothetical protein
MIGPFLWGPCFMSSHFQHWPFLQTLSSSTFILANDLFPHLFGSLFGRYRNDRIYVVAFSMLIFLRTTFNHANNLFPHLFGIIPCSHDSDALGTLHGNMTAWVWLCVARGFVSALHCQPWLWSSSLCLDFSHHDQHFESLKPCQWIIQGVCYSRTLDHPKYLILDDLLSINQLRWRKRWMAWQTT